MTVAKKGDNGPAAVVGAETNNADGLPKNSRDAPGVPDQTCTYRFLAGRCSQKRAGRKRGHPPPLVVSAADTRAGDGWRRFFSQCTPRPDLHTPIGLRGARKKGGRRRSTQGNDRQPRVIWRRRRSPPEKRALHRVTTLAGGQAGGRQQNPLTTTRRRENSRAPVVFCHTVDIYSKNTLGAGLDMHPPR